MSNRGSLLQDMLGLLSRLLGGNPPAPNPPTVPTNPPLPTPASPGEPPTLFEPRVLMIVYNPVIDAAAGKRLIDTMGWHDPNELATGYAADVLECSGGMVNYHIVERIEADELPVKKDGFQYKPADFVQHFRSGTGFHDPDAVDYEAIVAKFGLVRRIENDEIDEVWMFGGPYFGFFESSMAGAGAFWCNGPTVPKTERCSRRFVIMGFSYERGIGEMLEDLGHRTESVLAHRFGSEAALDRAYRPNHSPEPIAAPANLFERFIRYDRTAPGQANVGVLHYAPNSLRDYDWGNMTMVSSCCDDWLEFPNLPDPPRYRPVNARAWGSGDVRLHHKWWFSRLPRAAGQTNGVWNNWWSYAVDVNRA